MRSVVQRVSEASVTVGGEVVGAIGKGLLVLLGVSRGDTEEDAKLLASKIAVLRIFSDDRGKFNLSLLDVEGSALVVSQFTLHANVRKGRRPSFNNAAPPEVAEPLVNRFVELLEQEGVHVETGRFGATMQVRLCNDGPVTLILDTEDLKRPRRQHDKEAIR
ncbi:MAG: D-tyrosyl-tRNA(Tyr) deacylase [Nitrospiraceae bacterium]|nr:D-tyrosyl-tRNA(Tyr) deacylase [Nitrospiraceae bacterium]